MRKLKSVYIEGLIRIPSRTELLNKASYRIAEEVDYKIQHALWSSRVSNVRSVIYYHILNKLNK